jgi:hypothetical protein
MLKESSSSTSNFWNGKSAKKAIRDTHTYRPKIAKQIPGATFNFTSAIFGRRADESRGGLNFRVRFSLTNPVPGPPLFRHFPNDAEKIEHLQVHVGIRNQQCCSSFTTNSGDQRRSAFEGYDRGTMQDMKIMTPALKFISIALLATIIAVPAWAVNDRQVREAVEDELGEILPADNNPGGAAVVVRTDGRTLFFNFGTATHRKPITSDTQSGVDRQDLRRDVTVDGGDRRRAFAG